MTDTRTGIGWDSHRLVEGKPLIVGGVTIEHALGLDGHSDADVLTHAVIDALLGAAESGLGLVLFSNAFCRVRPLRQAKLAPALLAGMVFLLWVAPTSGASRRGSPGSAPGAPPRSRSSA